VNFDVNYWDIIMTTVTVYPDCVHVHIRYNSYPVYFLLELSQCEEFANMNPDTDIMEGVFETSISGNGDTVRIETLNTCVYVDKRVFNQAQRMVGASIPKPEPVPPVQGNYSFCVMI
jgi:hypothetical protein